jgi:hypothetical protein
MIKAGVFDVAIAALRSTSPAQWLSWRAPAGVLANAIFVLGWSLSCLQFPQELQVDKTQLLLDKGFFEIVIAMMKEFERRGPSKVGEACAVTVWGGIRSICSIDLYAPEASPIVRLLEGIPSTLRFCVEHPVVHLSQLGFDSSSDCASICALLFGKQEEGGAFEFTQEMIDVSVNSSVTVFSGIMAAFNPVLPSFFFRIWIQLCISDKNKLLLLKCPDLTNMMIEALLLDPSHSRQDQAAGTKAQIQRDAAECFAQLALFEPTREMLARDPAVLDALRTLAGGASTVEAQHCAEGALMSLAPENMLRGELSIDTENLHIMMSYQWGVQVGI